MCTGKCGGPDGCGGTCPNGCVSPQTCGGGGTPNVCGAPCVRQVAGGGFHTCAVKHDGTLWCWGYNFSGQVGNGTPPSTTPIRQPVQISKVGTTVVEVAAGDRHTCARKQDGTLWCWGDSFYGQAPEQVTALGTTVAEVAAGASYTCARTEAGVLWCWGRNDNGQVGDGTIQPKSPPVQVTALGSSVVEVSAGGYHACARKADGTLWCWGTGNVGQVGDGTTDSQKPSPVQVTLLGTAVAQVAAGGYHTCARKTDGTLWCWGRNDRGQLGDGTTTTPKPTPSQVQALGATVVDVAAGLLHTCARKADGTLWCWGSNPFGQVGDGTMTTPVLVPTQVAALGTSAVDVAAGDNHTCARRTGGTVLCWGHNDRGQVGDGTTMTTILTPTTAPLPCP
jgi:alpha-tubulin suppressor-like RCC1 family protein